MYIIIPHGDQHRMQIDQRNMVLDLSGVQDGSLVDPTITKVEWSQVLDGKRMRDGGIIMRNGDRTQVFYDRSALSPYIVAFEAEWLRRHHDQAEFEARKEREVVELSVAP